MNRSLPLLLGVALFVGCSEDEPNPGPIDIVDSATDSAGADSAGDGTVDDSGTADSAVAADGGTDTAKPESGAMETGASTDTGASADSTGDTLSASDAVSVDLGADIALLDTGSDTAVAAQAPASGDVVISEFLVRGSNFGGATEHGEYVELFNAKLYPVTLQGCTIRSGNLFVVEESAPLTITLAPGEYAVLRRESTGVTYPYTARATYLGPTFDDTAADYVELFCAATRIDSAAWAGHGTHPNAGTGGNYTPAPLVARERSTATLGSGPNGSIIVWCDATSDKTMTMGGTNATFKGSPGASNNCP